MKKTLLSMLAVTVFTGFAAAAVPYVNTNESGLRQKETAAARVHAAPEAQSDTVALSWLQPDEVVYQYDGFSVTEPTRVGFTIKLPQDKITAYANGKLVGLMVGWSDPENAGKMDLFVKTDMKSDNNVASKSTEVTFDYGNSVFEQGWNTVIFDKAVPMTEFTDGLYMGFFADLMKDRYCIPFSVYGIKHPDSQWITRVMDGKQEDWQDISEEYGPVCMKALVEMPDVTALTNIVAIDGITTQAVYTIGEYSAANLFITNDGINTIESIGLRYSMGDQSKEFSVKLLRPVYPGVKGMSAIVESYAFGTGEQTLEIFEVNGEPVENPASIKFNAIGVPVAVAEEHPHRPVIEVFVSENDHNSSRYMDEIFYPGFDEIEDDTYTVVAHHMGDQFMMGDDEDTQFLIDFYNGDKNKVGMPMFTLDRGIYTPLIDATIWTDEVPQWILYPRFAMYAYQAALDTSAFASVEVDKAETDGVAVNVEVSGNIAEDILPEGEDLYLTLYLVENGVESDSQEFPDDADFMAKYPDGIYTHNNLIRAQATPMYGENVGRGGDFTRNYTIDLYEGCNPKNMRVVALLSRSGSNDSSNRNIINSVEANLSTSGVENIDAERGVTISVDGNAISVEGALGFRVYDLAGARVSPEGLAAGVYVVAAETEGGNVSRKVIVK